VACDGVPPQTPQITGTPFGPVPPFVMPFAFSAPGLAAPTATAVSGPDGSIQSLQVSANPGTSTDPFNAFLGFGLPFITPPCVDAGAFTGVRFTVTGDLGTCSLTSSVIVSQDNSVAFGPFGTCTAAACFPPASGPLHTGVNVVQFADMTGGSPLPTVDPTALNGIQWTFTVPTDGVTAPCVANFTITDVAFVNGSGNDVHLVNYTFDRDPQGWSLNDFNGPPFTNLAVAPPPGSMPATLAFVPFEGDRMPGSLQVVAPFSALDQYADAIVNLPFPGIDLTGKTLHARVRLVSGSLPEGGVNFHVSSGPTFAFGGNFISADQFPPGVWVPITIDLPATAATTPGFDPTQIVQIGVQFFSGDGFPSFTGTPSVFEIDTVTD
jgi:hypothetical protein